MKYSIFTEILTVGLFVAYYFNWSKIIIRTRLSIRRFYRTHICQRVDPDFDLDLTWQAKVQPTGRKIEEPIQDPEKDFTPIAYSYYIEGLAVQASGTDNIVFINSVEPE